MKSPQIFKMALACLFLIGSLTSCTDQSEDLPSFDLEISNERIAKITLSTVRGKFFYITPGDDRYTVEINAWTDGNESGGTYSLIWPENAFYETHEISCLVVNGQRAEFDTHGLTYKFSADGKEYTFDEGTRLFQYAFWDSQERGVSDLASYIYTGDENCGMTFTDPIHETTGGLIIVDRNDVVE